MSFISLLADSAPQAHQRAIGATITSGISIIISHLPNVHDGMQDIAGVVAIISGCMAIAYYYVSIIDKLRNRKK